MGRSRQSGGRSSGERLSRDWIGGYRPRLRTAAKPPAVWAGVDEPQLAPYLAPTLEQEMLALAAARSGPSAGVIFGFAGRDVGGPFVVAVRVVPFAEVEPLEGGVRVPRPSWWELSRTWQEEFPDLEPVGWFRIQPGLGTVLGSYDRFTAYQRFADPLQFTWVLDPQRGRQALYAWEGAELVALPGYWRCTEAPQIPPRAVVRERRPAPAIRRAGVLGSLAALKPWFLAAAGAAALYLLLPFAPGSIPSRLRPAPTAPEAPASTAPDLAPGGQGGAGSGPILPLGAAEDPPGSPVPAEQGASSWAVPASPGPETGLSGDLSEPGPASSIAYISYQVGRGETLWSISLRLLGDPTRYQELAALNGITDPNQLEVGQILRIPIDLEGALK